MKKYLLISLLPLLAMACKNEGQEIPIPEADVMFNIETIASPENIYISYSSSDPCCGEPKSYSIHADGTPNELVMKCTNLDKISLIKAVERTFATVSDEGTTTRGKVSDTYVNFDNSACTFEIVDENVLKITLNELSEELKDKVCYTSVRFTIADASNTTGVKEELRFSRVYSIPMFK